MTADIDKLNFSIDYPIDKIAVEGTASYTVSGTATTTPVASLQSITNPFGHKCLMTVRWSVDGTNFYDMDGSINFFSATFSEFIFGAGVKAGCSDSTIYFYMINGYDTSKTFTINYTLYSIS